MGKPDKEVIRKHDYNHIYRAKQRQNQSIRARVRNGSCPCVYEVFSTCECCSLCGKRTFLFSADSRYNIGEGRAKTL